ncbi:hypothetical protein JI721_04700 [Alicyclobacillus cycloheptanicus]|uniref:Uncharacterized protein n=1 Tax=Alicyclobacillus cycloheptanicus TaxID=1457 RepID=A0ABT9XLM2_9BACL|nr:hypothetical protein [Alicyclobacillus cycloheptanicus]MDQ0191214.1 hypothetical protein [Alicyclobacillus cycloheptanicus]WDM02124.1 hypothetical protein JI721_04700 [Alicyclobacillus cycloheptanicus]
MLWRPLSGQGEQNVDEILWIDGLTADGAPWDEDIASTSASDNPTSDE